MKFQNLSRALLSITGAAGMILGLSSCSNDRTVGYVYVLGTTAAGSTAGTVGGLKEDNNNGNLTSIAGGPVGSGGNNPTRAVVSSGDRFLYVMNAGTPQPDTNTSSQTYNAVTGYSNAGISLFTIGGYGQLSPQLSYASQGYGATRIAINTSGTYLYVMDEYAPVGISSGSTSSPISVYSSSGAPANYPCQDPANPNIWHPVGDITLFAIDSSTGRLQVQPNQRQQNLNYFPVGCFPTDIRLTGLYLYTMTAGAASNGDVQTVNVQTVNNANGQLTPTQTANIQVPTTNGLAPTITAINGDGAGKYVYLLDTVNNRTFAYSVGTSGALTTISGSPFVSEPTVSGLGPVQSVTDSTGKYVYFANTLTASGNSNPNVAAADVTGYNVNQTTGDLLVPVANGSFNLGTVASPVCIFEDPTNQFLYVAGAADSSITGRKIDPQTGTLRDLNKSVAFPTVSNPSWCVGISSAQ